MRKSSLMLFAIACLGVSTPLLPGCKRNMAGRPSGVADSQPDTAEASDAHIYWTWESLEFDKCVAAWLIDRFVDDQATFCFYPKDTTDAPGTPFDVPGAAWSRKHLTCTSDCVFESLGLDDPAISAIVQFAHDTELNRWKLDQSPEAKRHFEKVREIMKNTRDPQECFVRSAKYFDELYKELVSQTGEPSD
jgi:hypothetical protein